MRKIIDPTTVKSWGYHDQRLGRGYTGTRESIIVQVQEAYMRAGIGFQEQEIPARIDDFMCSQGLASPCTDRVEGLGDVVKLLVAPIVDKIDYAFGTNLGECSGCKSRQEALNRAVPL